ncbi:GntR family transcriptional regulator/MocR family aminotransferase [Bacillus pakistanensis]|uniref:GntR family transcriptional regulator/MocR family aminotransferase n=1 Tax=Rossellomorea pakistanensis TaxID=992288 RepID=A0ABS2NIC0_9BACI|nr:PLP-dependent aminotransferase family protein [Bacillus pakistanensis]MBM7587524.1 GntR family transcriptional regulator/MocR family aminotransferase [Bacillus pakistanensis]
MFEITPTLDHNSKKPLYIQLSDYIKKEITAGSIQSKEKLPSKRKLSQYLDVSVNTVQAAYDQLCAEGYVESKQRKGLFVTSMKDDLFANQTYSQEWQTKDKQVYSVADIDFNSGTVDLKHFPYTAWRKLTMQSLYEDQGELLYTGDPQGEFPLRNEIAKYLYESRGVRCSADQIVIGAGTQVLMGLLCLIIGKESTYALENPGFHRTRAVLEHQSIKTIPIPLDDDGIEIKPLKVSDARVVYVTPSHQFPYGMVMPIDRRMELLKWAEQIDGYIIEDDYDGEYRYKGKPIPSLQGLDTNGRVIYLGTFSKSLIPSIRISYMVLPPSLIQKYQDRFTIYKQTVSRLHQDTLFRFMNEGHWQRHLNKMRTLYRKKQKSLMTAIHHNFRGQVNVIGEKSGLHIVLEIKKNLSEEELIKRAIKVGVKVYPISIYYEGKKKSDDPKILLGFGGLSEKEIEEGIRLLKEVWRI